MSHSIPVFQAFLQVLLCGCSAPFTSLTLPCPDFSPLLLPFLLPAVEPSLLCLEDFDSWKSQKALIKRSIVQLFPSLSCIWSLRSLNSSLRKCSMCKEARGDFWTALHRLCCARFCTAGNESLQPHKQMCKGAQHRGLCQKEGTAAAAGPFLSHLTCRVMERSHPELQVQSTKLRAQEKCLSPELCSGAETTQDQPSSRAAAAGIGLLCAKLSCR